MRSFSNFVEFIILMGIYKHEYYIHSHLIKINIHVWRFMQIELLNLTPSTNSVVEIVFKIINFSSKLIITPHVCDQNWVSLINLQIIN